MQYYTPPASHLGKDFFKALFMGDKKLYKISEVKYIQVPLLDDLSIENMKKLIDKDADILKCFPDEY